MKKILTDRLQSFKGYKNISWGLQKRIIDIIEAQQLYINLLEKNEYKLDEPLSIGAVKLLPEQYIPPRESMHKEVQINNILKNNFHNGSYILEFFDEAKNDVKFFLDNPKLLNDFSEQLSSILPIKIGTLSDRLGNVIFQLPINSFEMNHDSIVDRTQSYPKFQGFKIEIFPKIDSFKLENLLIRIYEDDETITRQKIISVKNNVTKIYLDDTFGTYIEIIDTHTELLLYRFRVYLMKYMNSSINLIELQKRVFELNGQQVHLEVSTSGGNTVHGKIKNKSYKEWISNRIYTEQLNVLGENKSFIQFFENEDNKALSDIREIINKYGEKGVYLWDPYLSAVDIKNTLYYAKNTYLPMKAISGLKQHSSKEKAKQDMISEFQKDKKEFLSLDLEVRGKLGSHGYDFHDRFLIFPLENPKVWSLGISVNQIGKSHHVFQKIENPQHIVNAFDKLWDELNHEECLVWKSN